MMQATFEEDKNLPLNGIEQRAKLGDTWKLGRHRLYCGDATNADDVAALMGNDKIDLILTDPPFFTPASHYQSRVKYQRKFSDLSTLSGFLNCVMLIALPYVKNEGHMLLFCNCDSYAVFYPLIFSKFEKTKSLIWDKKHVGLGRIFRHQHELIIWGRNEGHYFKPDGKLYSDVLSFEATPSKDRLHPVEKPIALLENLITPLTSEGGTICDLFGGGGGVLIACEKLGRTCRMMELDPQYCDIIIARWEQATGMSGERIEKILD